MFLLNNIHNRDYETIYNRKDVVFDLSENQLKNINNSAWRDIIKDSIVCVVTTNIQNQERRIRNFYRIHQNFLSSVVSDNGNGYLHLITGELIARNNDNASMTALLNRYNVRHNLLPNNQFSIGFNVANLGDALNDLPLNTRDGIITLGELKVNA